jgi:hypothetical protein
LLSRDFLNLPHKDVPFSRLVPGTKNPFKDNKRKIRL